MDIDVAEHALKHGLTESEILYAWENFLRKQHRQTPNEDVVVAVGVTQSGDLIQMVAIDKPWGTLIYHALKPPTMKVLIELGMVRS